MTMTIPAWESLPEDMAEELWKRVAKRFAFDPFLDGAKSRFEPPEPNTIIDLMVYEEPADIKRLNIKILDTLAACCAPDERVYLLDPYQRQGLFCPHSKNAEQELFEYPGGFYANEEYKLCLAEDFRFGFLSNPWKRTMQVFGAELLVKVEKQDWAD